VEKEDSALGGKINKQSRWNGIIFASRSGKGKSKEIKDLLSRGKVSSGGNGHSVHWCEIKRRVIERPKYKNCT